MKVKGYKKDKIRNWSYFNFPATATVMQLNIVGNDKKLYKSMSNYSVSLVVDAEITSDTKFGSAQYTANITSYVSNTLPSGAWLDYTDLKTGTNYNKSPLVTMAYVIDDEPFTFTQTGPTSYYLALKRITTNWSDKMPLFAAGWFGKLPAVDKFGNTVQSLSVSRVAGNISYNNFIPSVEYGNTTLGITVNVHAKD